MRPSTTLVPDTAIHAVALTEVQTSVVRCTAPVSSYQNNKLVIYIAAWIYRRRKVAQLSKRVPVS